MSKHCYSNEERAAIYRVIFERRDMRHFLPAAIAPDVLTRLLDAAHHAPSVGFMQPWRFIRITKVEIRKAMHALVEQERIQTARALNEREDEFMRLKVEGILECAEILVATLCDQREQHIFGRRTLPEMDLASVSCAIQNMWLAARAEGLGMGWVSLFDPDALKEILHMPADSKPIAILCLGHVTEFYDQPLLEKEAWATRQKLNNLVFENIWDPSCR
jgi:5,6-dimethylbenzimidazole synthase